ncbi:hypothetical protein ABNG02_02040 [Halorubrum ejinorense]|uniref:Uncharacterized protein n=1 Tax=Halorubrum ejinorense TaxID=425309 RepID=A0AAV3SMG3_9EURY
MVLNGFIGEIKPVWKTPEWVRRARVSSERIAYRFAARNLDEVVSKGVVGEANLATTLVEPSVGADDVQGGITPSYIVRNSIVRSIATDVDSVVAVWYS